MAQLADIQTTQRQLEDSFSKRMADLEEQLHLGGPAKDTVSRVAEEFRTFREIMFHMLRLLRQQIDECARMIDITETRHRRKALLFVGVPESAEEDCTGAVLDIVNKTMGVIDISPAALRVCHRLGTRNKDHHRPILVRFAAAEEKSAVWRVKSKLKGSSVSVKEFLTKSRQIVFGKARQHFGVRACWTQDGVISVKVPDGSRHKITTLEELNILIAKYPATTANSSSALKSGSGSRAKPRKN